VDVPEPLEVLTARDLPSLSGDDNVPDTLGLKTGPVELCAESPLMDDGDDDDYVPSPVLNRNPNLRLLLDLNLRWLKILTPQANQRPL